jgi:hypothetical protein
MSPSPSQSVENPSSPTSLTLPTRVSPLFMSPQSSTSPEQPPPSSTTGPSPSLDPSDAVPSWSTDAPEGLSDPGPTAPSDTPSIPKGVRLSKAGLRTGLGTGFRQVCKLIASVIADQEERELGLWTPDADDVDDISGPAANIVYRRLPDDAKGGDLIDLFALGLAVVGYVGKNLQHRSAIRTNRRLQAAQGITVEAGETP